MTGLAQLIGSDGTVHYSAPEGHPEVEKWKNEIVERKLGYEVRILSDGTNWVDPLTAKQTRWKLYMSCKLSGFRKWIPFTWVHESDINDNLRIACEKCSSKCQFDRTKDLDYKVLVKSSLGKKTNR